MTLRHRWTFTVNVPCVLVFNCVHECVMLYVCSYIYIYICLWKLWGAQNLQDLSWIVCKFEQGSSIYTKQSLEIYYWKQLCLSMPCCKYSNKQHMHAKRTKSVCCFRLAQTICKINKRNFNKSRYMYSIDLCRAVDL